MRSERHSNSVAVVLSLLLFLFLLNPLSASSSAGARASSSSARDETSAPGSNTDSWAALISSPASPPSSLLTVFRKAINLSGWLGSRTDLEAFDRVAGHPVFAVTTPWGSPYMSMEKLSDLEEDATVPRVPPKKGQQTGSISEEQNEYRTVALFFMDPDDALGVHGEMKQLENMKKADMRLTAFSLSKALRHASNLGNGLLTGLPPDPLDGTYKYDDGASLRYKIVPPKRQLYYAARCHGRERVGLLSENPVEDAQAAVLGNSALEGMNLVRRREKRERKGPKKKNLTQLQADNQHMEGYTGIPVFYEPQLVRRVSWLKRLASGTQDEIPLFFNYEDLEVAWSRVRSKARFKSRIPANPPAVEVFNLWDVLTSIDREARQKREMMRRDPKQYVLEPLRKRFAPRSRLSASASGSGSTGGGSSLAGGEDATTAAAGGGGGGHLDQIVFVPSSRSITYKEAMSARGNGKCRLRPMR